MNDGFEAAQILLLLLLWAFIGGGIGFLIGRGRGNGPGGLLLGFLFGPLGWLITALLPINGRKCAQCLGRVPDAAAAVLLFPVDRRAWRDFGGKSRRLVSARVSTKGRYQISAPPPGEYLIVAVAADRVDNWSDLKTLELLGKAATRIRIDDSQLLSQDLRTAHPW